MELKKYRWSKEYEPTEEDLRILLDRKGINAERWDANPAESFKTHAHTYDKRLWCVEGSIAFTIGERTISLQSGDALDLPASTMHEATAGLSGCMCYEAQAHSA